MVVADGRKMSKHLGNVVDPDELVERHGADTVRLAILYAAGPAKTLNWNDGAMRFASRFLNSLWDYAIERFAAVEAAPLDEEAETDTGFMRDRLVKWCDNGVERITDDLAELQMHKAVRNVTRLFERIQDFEKRVVKRRGSAQPRRRRGARRGAGPAAAGAGALRAALRRGSAGRGRTRGRCRVAELAGPSLSSRYPDPTMFELQRGNLDKRRMRFAKAGGLPSRTRSCAGR